MYDYFKDVEVRDMGLANYINLDPIYSPLIKVKYLDKYCGKGNINIVSRFLNQLMRTETFTGKKSKAYKVLLDAFKIIENKNKNPVQVLVDAICNSAPREEVTRLVYGGASVPKSVDISPQRRVNIAIANLAKSAISHSFKNKRGMEECLAFELLSASQGDSSGSRAIARREEIERVAQSAR